MATGTLSPSPKFYAWNVTTGAPLAGGLVYTYEAETTTAATTWTDSSLTVANANPIILNSAGYGTIYLQPGNSYKFIIKDADGVVQWTQDNIPAVPASSSALDITGTAGESLVAGNAVYLSDGSGSKTAGQWYQASASNPYSGSTPLVGLVPFDIDMGSTGTIRLSGSVGGLSLVTGALYYLDTTAGAITTTPTGYARFIGQADTSSTLLVSTDPPIEPIAANNSVVTGRLTLTSGAPVTSTDVTAATTLYFAPYAGNRVALYTSGGAWVMRTFSQLSIAVPSTTTTVYDVFVYDNSGVAALELTAWTDATTRATALTTQDGVLVKSGATTRRWIGSFRTTGVSGQTEDSFANRLLYNAYNQVEKPLRQLESTASWTYGTTNTLRQANASTANQVTLVNGAPSGFGPNRVQVQLTARAANNNNNATLIHTIGENSTTAQATGVVVKVQYGVTVAGTTDSYLASLSTFPGVGYSYYAWLEATDTATMTSYGTATQAGVSVAFGLTGSWWC